MIDIALSRTELSSVRSVKFTSETEIEIAELGFAFHYLIVARGIGEVRYLVGI